MIPVILAIVNWCTKNFKVVAVGFVSLLIAAIFFQHNLLLKRNKEIDRITNNVRAYEDIAANKELLNRVLLLTILELNTSKDSLILEVKHAQKELKIKDKNLISVNVINTEINDSTKVVIKEKSIDFNEELKLNPLTTITVSRKDSILTAKLELKNQQILFVENKKEYKRLYKNGWIRFLRLDFKKIHTKKYQIVNSNNLIKVTSTRVIELQ